MYEPNSLLSGEQEDALDAALDRREQETKRQALAGMTVSVDLPSGTAVIARAEDREPTPEGRRGTYYRWRVHINRTEAEQADAVYLCEWVATVGQARFRMESLAKWSA